MLEVGKIYPTKNGMAFHCEKDISDIDVLFPFGGWVKLGDEKDRFAYYTAIGTYKLSPSEYDLVL